ncbi:MAG: restriction endonuclease subunit S, partial [Planctomycetes bacterium]|nr:restriction endonuclease subunit S [Planctomycetota bacterium]
MWRLTKLKELGKVVTGSTPSTLKPENFGQGYLFIKPPDLHEGRRKIFETETEISDLGAQTQYGRLLPANTPFVVCIGTIGKLGLTTRPSFTNQQINSVLVNQEQHDSLFVYYLLKNSIPEVKQLNGGSASGRENVNKSTFENIAVRVPPLSVQQRIAGILSAYDDLIENSQRRIKILESMARALYRELFVRGNAPGGILEPCVLGDICSLVKLPFSETRDGDRPLLDLSRIPQASIAPADTGLSSELTTSRILFERGDTLFGAIRCYLHK